MTPKIKIMLRAALGCLGLFVAFLAVYFGLFFIAILLVVITTLFASSSKFAKEVNNIQLWKRIMGGRYNDYPQAKDQLAGASVALRSAFSAFMMDFAKVKDEYGARKKKYRGAHLGQHLESKMAYYETEIADFWRLLEYFDMVPLDSLRQCPWEGWESFVENTCSDPSSACMFV